VSDPAVVVVVIGCRSGGGWWCCGGREEKKQIARAAAAAAAAEHRRTADNNTRTRAKQPKNRSRKIARAYDRPLRNPCARCVTRKVTRVGRCPQAHEKYEKHHHHTISSRREYRARGRGLLVGVGVALTIDVGSSSAHVVELHQTCEDLARPIAGRYSIRFDSIRYLVVSRHDDNRDAREPQSPPPPESQPPPPPESPPPPPESPPPPP